MEIEEERKCVEENTKAYKKGKNYDKSTQFNYIIQTYVWEKYVIL